MEKGSNNYKFEYVLNEFLVSQDSEELLFKLAKKTEKKELLEKDGLRIPLCIFREGHSSLRAIVKYLREQKNLRFSEIASLTYRDQRTIWASYDSVKNSKKSRQENLWAERDFIPLELLKDRNLSVLEDICVYLRKNHSVGKIAELLSKNPKTISTVLRRAKIKGKKVL